MSLYDLTSTLPNMVSKSSFWIILSCALLKTCLAQNNTLSTNTSIPTPADNSSTPVPTNEIVSCSPGILTGYGLVRKPNISSTITVGTPYNVSWDWTVTVTKPPSYLDIYIQLFANGVPEKWNTVVAKNVPSDPRWFIWTPIGLVDGKYKLRFVPEGKETFNIPANLLPCFANGESVPFVTAQFSVSNLKGDLGVYGDPYAPNSARKLSFETNLFSFLVPLLLAKLVLFF